MKHISKISKSYFFWALVACLAVYLPSLWNDFQTSWDDQWMVVNRYTESGFTAHNLRAIFTDFYYGQYGPLNQLVYTTIYAMFGYNAVIFHLYSLLLHFVNCCLLFVFLKLIASSLVNQASQANIPAIAFGAALLFAIHPLQVESIAWISASKIPLYTFFTLLSMLSYLRYISSQKPVHYLLAFLFFVCSYGCKEQSIVLPAALLLLDWTLRRFNGKNWAMIVVEKIPFILFALFGGFLLLSHTSSDWIARVAGFPLLHRVVFICYSLVVYAGRFVFPFNLMHLYLFPITPGNTMPAAYLVYPAIIAVAFILICINIKKIPRLVIFGIVFFLVNVALMIHVIPMSRPNVTADRYVYLASAGLFFIAAFYAVPWLQKMKVAGNRWALALAACYLLYLGGYAHVRTYAWKNSETLKRGYWEMINFKPSESEDEQPKYYEIQ